jgi:hypothetical protein
VAGIATLQHKSTPIWLQDVSAPKGIDREDAPRMDTGAEPNPLFENGQDIRDRTFEFACRVVRFCENLYSVGGVSRMMVPQLINCSAIIRNTRKRAGLSPRTRSRIPNS